MQSVLILVSLLILDHAEAPALPHPRDALLLIELWDMKAALARTGLFLNEEICHTLPNWRQWTLTEAKRRTIQSLNHLEWAWSVLNGYPVLTCFELGPLPAPAASQLWRASDEKAWTDLYIEWLWRWKDGSYKMVEFFYIEPKGQLDRRSELWLSEADEFGLMLMAEGESETSMMRDVLC